MPPKGSKRIRVESNVCNAEVKTEAPVRANDSPFDNDVVKLCEESNQDHHLTRRLTAMPIEVERQRREEQHMRQIESLVSENNDLRSDLRDSIQEIERLGLEMAKINTDLHCVTSDILDAVGKKESEPPVGSVERFLTVS